MVVLAVASQCLHFQLTIASPAGSLYGGMVPRGSTYLFGEDICAQFCHRNNVEMIARSHQLTMEGYEYMFDKKLVTIWSTPNYRGRCGNSGAIMEVDERLRKQFLVVPPL